jgi:hypothetical protein
MCRCRKRWRRVPIEFVADLALTGKLRGAGHHAELKEQTYLLFLTNL